MRVSFLINFVSEDINVRLEVFSHLSRKIITEVTAVFLHVFCLTFRRQRRRRDPNTPAGLFIIFPQVLVFPYEVHQNSAVKVSQVVRLTLNGGVDMVLVWAVRVKFPSNEG